MVLIALVNYLHQLKVLSGGLYSSNLSLVPRECNMSSSKSPRPQWVRVCVCVVLVQFKLLHLHSYCITVYVTKYDVDGLWVILVSHSLNLRHYIENVAATFDRYSTPLKKSVCPDSKVDGANMGPTCVLSAPDGPHVGPMYLAIRVAMQSRVSNGHSIFIRHLMPFANNFDTMMKSTEVIILQF